MEKDKKLLEFVFPKYFYKITKEDGKYVFNYFTYLRKLGTDDQYYLNAVRIQRDLGDKVTLKEERDFIQYCVYECYSMIVGDLRVEVTQDGPESVQPILDEEFPTETEYERLKKIRDE